MLTLSTTAVAKQLTKIEYDLFRAVPSSEFMDICKSNVPRPSLSRLVEHTNKISYWVATQIVTLSRSKDKVKMLHKFITLAEKCARLKNYASASAILIGLNLSLISRLKDIWEALPSKQLALFEKIKSIPMADANYRRLRSLVRREKVRLERLEMLSHHVKDVDPALLAAPANASSTAEATTHTATAPELELAPPVIPFMAIYNKDFTFVEEQPTNHANGKVNHDKMQVVGGLLREIHLFQHQMSSIEAMESDPVVENYLANISYLSEDTLWSLSGIHTSLRS